MKIWTFFGQFMVIFANFAIFLRFSFDFRLIFFIFSSIFLRFYFRFIYFNVFARVWTKKFFCFEKSKQTKFWFYFDLILFRTDGPKPTRAIKIANFFFTFFSFFVFHFLFCIFIFIFTKFLRIFFLFLRTLPFFVIFTIFFRNFYDFFSSFLWLKFLTSAFFFRFFEIFCEAFHLWSCCLSPWNFLLYFLFQ